MSAAAGASTEVTFYFERGVQVTNARLIVGSITYAMANITSVRSSVAYPNRVGPVLMCLVGVLLTVIRNRVPIENGTILLVGGGFCIALGIGWWISQKPTYRLRITSASGESTPVEDRDSEWIDGILQAVNEAIIQRG